MVGNLLAIVLIVNVLNIGLTKGFHLHSRGDSIIHDVDEPLNAHWPCDIDYDGDVVLNICPAGNPLGTGCDYEFLTGSLRECAAVLPLNFLPSVEPGHTSTFDLYIHTANGEGGYEPLASITGLELFNSTGPTSRMITPTTTTAYETTTKHTTTRSLTTATTTPPTTSTATLTQETSLPPDATPELMESAEHGLSSGAKAGIGVGVSAGALLIIVAILFFVQRRRKRKELELGALQAGGRLPVEVQSTGGQVLQLPASRPSAGVTLLERTRERFERGG